MLALVLTFTIVLAGCPDPSQTAAEKAASFRADHATALALEVASVATANKGIVEAALTAYAGLGEDVKALLGTEKAKLDSLSAKITLLEGISSLVTALGEHAAANGPAVTLTGDSTPTADVTVPAGVTLTVASGTLTVGAGRTLTIAATGVVTVTGVLDVAATGIVKVDGTITYDTDDATNVVHATGSKFVYSSTANPGLTDAYIGGTSSTTPTWTVGAGALFTEIAGTTSTGTRRNWTHEISGGTVTLNKKAAYGTVTDDSSSLTVTSGGKLRLATESDSQSVGLIIKASGGQLILENFSSIDSTSTGVLFLNKSSGASEAASTATGTGKVTVNSVAYTVQYIGAIAGLTADTLTVNE
jgi:hypothetical protein